MTASLPYAIPIYAGIRSHHCPKCGRRLLRVDPPDGRYWYQCVHGCEFVLIGKEVSDMPHEQPHEQLDQLVTALGDAHATAAQFAAQHRRDGAYASAGLAAPGASVDWSALMQKVGPVVIQILQLLLTLPK